MLVDNKVADLSMYRINNAKETLDTAKLCMEHKRYKDTINRCYYAAFYAVRAVLALEGIDFKRHKDAVAYFNQNYVAADIFEREIGKKLGRDEELWDVIYYTIAIANLYDIDLEQVIKSKEAMNQSRYPSAVVFEENR